MKNNSQISVKHGTLYFKKESVQCFALNFNTHLKNTHV